MPTVPSGPPMGSMGSMGEYDEYLESQKPSPTHVLLAAATMHNQGTWTNDHIGFGGKVPNLNVRRTSTGAPAGRGRRR